MDARKTLEQAKEVTAFKNTHWLHPSILKQRRFPRAKAIAAAITELCPGFRAWVDQKYYTTGRKTSNGRLFVEGPGEMIVNEVVIVNKATGQEERMYTLNGAVDFLIKNAKTE